MPDLPARARVAHVLDGGRCDPRTPWGERASVAPIGRERLYGVVPSHLRRPSKPKKSAQVFRGPIGVRNRGPAGCELEPLAQSGRNTAGHVSGAGQGAPRGYGTTWPKRETREGYAIHGAPCGYMEACRAYAIHRAKRARGIGAYGFERATVPPGLTRSWHLKTMGLHPFGRRCLGTIYLCR